MKKEALFIQYLKRKHGFINVKQYLPPNNLGFYYFLGQTPKNKKVFIKLEGKVKQAAAREACLLKILHQKNKTGFFPNLLAYQTKGSFPFIATEFIRGMTLDKYLLHNKPGNNQKKKLLQQMKLILGVLQRAKIVHRDIRPVNLMVQVNKNQQLRLILIDFAYAVRLHPYPLPELSFLSKNKPILEKLGRDFRPTASRWDDAYSFCKIAQLVEPHCQKKHPKIWAALSSCVDKLYFD